MVWVRRKSANLELQSEVSARLGWPKLPEAGEILRVANLPKPPAARQALAAFDPSHERACVVRRAEFGLSERTPTPPARIRRKVMPSPVDAPTELLSELSSGGASSFVHLRVQL